MKISWRDLELLDADGYPLHHAERVEALAAWRMTHRLPQGYAFGPVDAAHEDAEGYGPQVPAEVDWTGFPSMLGSLPAGPVPPEAVARVVKELVDLWPHLEGGEAAGMHPGKLQRIEDPAWSPPVLSFTLERHGATVHGSSRAEAQRWAVDLEDMTASVHTVGRRQLYKMQAAWSAAEAAAELAAAIISGKGDEKLQRNDDGSVTVLTTKVMPSASEQTTHGRRRRLWAEMEKLLAPYGWQRRLAKWHKPE